MPVFKLGQAHHFPPVAGAEPEGILAYGGDLSPARLKTAYEHGIFPWYNEGEPILWWSPDPRAIIKPAAVRVTASMERVLKQQIFTITMDRDFAGVMSGCRHAPRLGQDGTWITADMVAAYCRMFDLGLGHSVECWQEGHLVGGLYGLSLGRCFFGESMFSHVTNASKAALITLCRALQGWGFDFVDCQLPTPHLMSMGAVEIARDLYLVLLRQALQYPTRQGRWDLERATGLPPLLNPADVR